MKLNVVIVDDDAVVLFLHKILLQRSDLPCKVHDFSHPEKALAFLKQPDMAERPTLILLDINMPKMDGWQFLEELQHQDLAKRVFVVMVTSSINISDYNKAQKYPLVLDYLEKPLSIKNCEELHQRIRLLLNGS